jgi:histidinol-phosphatase (PHP family)
MVKGVPVGPELLNTGGADDPRHTRHMILSNLHTHCSYSDGKQDPEAIVEEAIRKGFHAIGFSSHAPVPFVTSWAMKEERAADYVKTISGLKDAYRDRIEIYLGMEIDYFADDDRDIFTRYPLDYTIGSVHFVTDGGNCARFAVDASKQGFDETLRLAFGGDIRRYVRAYYGMVDTMVNRHRPSIVGHFDLVKKFNRAGGYFREDDQWYADAVTPVLRSIAAQGLVVEINTSVRYRDLADEPYPSQWILKECRRLGIPVTVNSDAHRAAFLDGCFDEARTTMKDAGYTTQRILLGGKWTDVEI